MNQEIKEQAHKEFEKSADTADQFVDNAKVIPLNSAILLCNLAIDKTVQITEERIVDKVKQIKIVLNPINVLGKTVIEPSYDYRNGYSNALKDVLSLITNK